MADTLKQLGRDFGKTKKDLQLLRNRVGYLPQVERTRGNMSSDSPHIAPFSVNQDHRKISLNLSFYKPYEITLVT